MIPPSNASLYDGCPLTSDRLIRLLRIQPTEDNAKEIACSLEAFEINKTPPYTALSYTWGPATEDGDARYTDEVEEAGPIMRILVNDHPFKITPNLYDALVALQQLKQYQHFWIDAICIDQSNLDEKSLQIPLIGNIFRTAEEVLAWLGSVTPSDQEDILWFLEVFIPHIKDRLGSNCCVLDSPSPSESESAALRSAFIEDPKSRPRAFDHLSKSRWFSRLWIAQELAIARSFRFLYGIRFLTHEELNELQLVLLNSGTLLSDGDHTFRKNLINLQYFWRFLRQFDMDNTQATSSKAQNQRAGQTLVHLTNAARNLGCSDPRDKVYASFVILDYLWPRGRQGHQLLAVDYSANVEKVYQNAVAWSIDQGLDLKYLAFIEDPSERQLSTLPSWVPDFSVPQLDWRSRLDFFDATGACTFGKFAHPYDNKLIVRSSYVGNLLDIGLLLPYRKGGMSTGMFDLDAMLAFCRLMKPTYTTGESRIEALWRTLAFNNIRRIPGTLANERSVSAKDFWTWLYIEVAVYTIVDTYPLLQHLEHDGDDDDVSRLAEIVVQKTDDTMQQQKYRYMVLKYLAASHPAQVPKLSGILAEVHLCLINAIQKRCAKESIKSFAEEHFRVSDETLELQRFFSLPLLGGGKLYLFICDSGHIGLGPLSTKPGDQVHLMHGCGFPLVLRPCGSSRRANGDVLQTFRVIGAAYVHGIMSCENHDRAFCDLFSDIVLV